MADQLLFALKSQPARGSSAGNNERLRLQPFIIGFDAHVTIPQLKIGHFRVSKTGAEFFRLLVHVYDELRPINSVWKAWVIFHERRGRKLAARLTAFQHKGIQIGARRINGSGQSRAAAPDDDHLLHE